MPWHITESKNIQSILKNGLRPAIGERSQEVGEEVPAIHLFSRFDDLESANWIEDTFPDPVRLSLLHVSTPPEDGAWTEISEPIPADRVTLVSLDLDDLAGPCLKALRALDGNEDFLSDPETFRATRTSMPARDFGRLIGDAQWEGDEAEFLVYGAGYWIEVLEDGRHMLTLENTGMITGNGVTLEDLESSLFSYVKDSRDPLPTDTPEP